MANTPSKINKRDDEPPDFRPLSPSETAEEAVPKSAAAESAALNPTFGGKVQPQQVLDREVVGSSDVEAADSAEGVSHKFDPEQDPRMQLDDKEV